MKMLVLCLLWLLKMLFNSNDVNGVIFRLGLNIIIAERLYYNLAQFEKLCIYKVGELQSRGKDALSEM